MRSLSFRKDFREMILSGDKTATLRMGWKDYTPGEIVNITVDSTVIATAVITSVRRKKWHQITDDDAGVDGFSTIDELRDVLVQIYGPFEDDTVFTQIKFRVVQSL